MTDKMGPVTIVHKYSSRIPDDHFKSSCEACELILFTIKFN